MSTSTTILSAQTHVGDGSVQTHTGDKYQGDGYYGRSDGFHTAQFNYTGFLGTVKLQGTLATNPVAGDWFDITGTDITTTYSQDGVDFKNFTGNFVWVRVVIENWTDGTINSVLLNH